MILDGKGRPIDPRAHATAQRMHNVPELETVDDLPPWIEGLSYRAADDVSAMRVRVPASPRSMEHLVSLEMDAEQLDALIGGLCRLREQCAKNRAIIDVPTDDD